MNLICDSGGVFSRLRPAREQGLKLAIPRKMFIM